MSGPQLILPALWSGTLWASGHSLPDFKDSLFWSSFFPQDVKCYVGHSPIQAFVCVLRGRGWGRDGKFDILVITYSSYSYRGGPLCHIISISTTPLRKWIKWRIGSLFEKLISLKQNIISYIFLFFFFCQWTWLSLPHLVSIIKLKIQAYPIETHAHDQCYISS